MKSLSFIFFVVLIFSCNQHRSKNKFTTSTLYKNKTSITKLKIDCDTASWYNNPIDRDSVLVYDNEGEKAYYTKGELKRILKSYPELSAEHIYGTPNEVFARKGGDAKLAPCDVHRSDCEVCQDNYYILYAYFFKQRNGDAKYHNERTHLIDLFRNINFLFSRLKGGGTYFGHQYRRIVGYAEYAISMKVYDEKIEALFKRYDITKQRRFYTEGLKQLIEDTVNNDYDIALPINKQKVKRELFETVNQIDRLITNDFYLKMTQQFQYSNY